MTLTPNPAASVGERGAYGSTVDLEIAFEVRVHAPENLDERAFPGAILARQHMDLAGPYLEVDLRAVPSPVRTAWSRQSCEPGADARGDVRHGGSVVAGENRPSQVRVQDKQSEGSAKGLRGLPGIPGHPDCKLELSCAHTGRTFQSSQIRQRTSEQPTNENRDFPEKDQSQRAISGRRRPCRLRRPAPPRALLGPALFSTAGQAPEAASR
jgi:hypothetical protein